MKKYLCLIGLIALVVTGCLQIETGSESNHTVLNPPDPAWLSAPVEPAVVEPAPETVETEEPETSEPQSDLPDAEITLSAIGDIIGSSENFQAVKSGDVYEFSSHFRDLRDTFKQHDFTIASLASPIAGADFGYGGHPRYNAPIELAQAVVDIGIDAVSTANRYAFDLGQRALISNLNNLKEIGLTAFGTADSQEAADQPLLVETGGIKLGLLSYTTLLNQSTAQMPFAVAIADQTRISQDIADLRDRGAEIISVSMYWGDEYADMPNSNQYEWMSFLESQGVDIVLGGHPHVVQPLVLKTIDYEGRSKTMVQAYSLGNFYSAFLMTRAKMGLLLEIDITRQNGRAGVADVRHQLLYNHQTERDDGLTDYRIINLATLEERRNDVWYNEMKSERDRVEELLKALDN